MITSPAAPSRSTPARKLPLAIALISLVTLLLELALTRVFDVILAPNLAYMVITSAVFAFGIAGLYATLFPISPGGAIEDRLGLVAVLFAVTSVTLLPVLNGLPFQFDQLEDHPVRQLVAFAAMYLALVIPFFLSGLFLTTAFSRYAGDIQRLYGWDLAGAAVGCLALVVCLPALGPGGLFLLIAAIGLLVAALLIRGRTRRAGLLSLAAVALIAAFALPAQLLDVRNHMNKRGVQRAQAEGRVEFTRWDPVSKIDVIPTPRVLGSLGDSVVLSNARWVIAYDGGQQSSNFFVFDGDLGRLRAELDRALPGTTRRNFTQRGVLVSHYLKRDQRQKVLIFGSAGGQETKAALVYGAGRIDAVEMVGTVVDLGTTRYARAIGDIFHNPAVRVRVGEGRSFLRASHERYDIIQIFSNSTSSSIASGSGALSPTYLLTVDAFKEYFTHLEPDGILHINHLVYPRMITTAAAAWRALGRTDFRRHVVVMERPWGPDNLPTLLIRMTPWTAEQVAEVDRFFAADTVFGGARRMAENPLHPEASFLSDDFYSGAFPAALADQMAWRATPATDDHPFFEWFRKRIAVLEPDRATFLSPAVASVLNSQLKRGRIPLDQAHLFVVGTVGLLFAGLAVGIPLRFARVGREHWPGKRVSMAYFACLGAGFMTVELVLIQLFMKLIGYPVYTYSVVIFGLLASAGLGSRLSATLDIRGDGRWSWPFIGVLGSVALVLLAHQTVLTDILAASLLVRILAALLFIFPLGVFLGMPFPLGILMIERQPRGAVAWAWGLNGIFTQIGGLASVLLSLACGFRVALLGGAATYAAALALYARMRRTAEVPEQITEAPAPVWVA